MAYLDRGVLGPVSINGIDELQYRNNPDYTAIRGPFGLTTYVPGFSGYQAPAAPDPNPNAGLGPTEFPGQDSGSYEDVYGSSRRTPARPMAPLGEPLQPVNSIGSGVGGARVNNVALNNLANALRSGEGGESNG